MKKLIIIAFLLFFGCTATKSTVKGDEDNKNTENIEKTDEKKDETQNNNTQKVEKTVKNENTEKITNINSTENNTDNSDNSKVDENFNLDETDINAQNILKLLPKLQLMKLPENNKQFEKTVNLLFHLNHFKQLKEFFAIFNNESLFSNEIKAIYKQIKDISIVDTNKIGIIIPKNSNYKILAEDLLNGLEFAKEKFNINFEFVIKETNASKEETIQAVEDLIFNEHVFMVIGTIKRSNTFEASLICEKFNVPFIALSNDDETPLIGKNTFSYFVSIENSTDYLAKYMIEKLKYTKFGIFYPNSSYGQKNMAEFWKSVEKYGGEVTTVQSYSHNSVEFIEPTQKLVGRFFAKNQESFTKRKKEIMEKYKGLERQKELEKLEKDVEPIIDFDVLFIPDSAKKIALILPYLALYDMSFNTPSKWQQFLAKKRAEDKNYKQLKFVQLAGTETWASNVIIDAAAKYSNGAMFPVVYDTLLKDEKMQSFTTGYREKFSKKPSVFSLYGYEVLDIINQTVNKSQNKSNIREEIVNSLSVDTFETVSGNVKFDSKNTVKKDELFMMLFTDKDYKQFNFEKENEKTDKNN